MELISQEKIEKILQRGDISDPAEMEKHLGRLIDEQPVIVDYLMEGEEDEPDEDETRLAFSLCTLIWLIMSEGKLSLRQVTEEQLAAAETNNLELFDSLSKKKHNSAEKFLEGMFQNYPQPHLLSFVLDAVTQEEELENIGEESGLVLLLEMKTIIDCLDSV